MNCNEFRKLRLQTCARAQQHTTKMSNITTISSRMQTVKLPPIHGASPAGGLRPHPPPKKKGNGSSLSAEEKFQYFGLRCREDKTGEEVRQFLREGRQKRPASGPRSKTILPQLSVQKTKCQSISEYNEDIRKAARLNFLTEDEKRILRTRAQQYSAEEREMSQMEIEAKQDQANFLVSYKDANPLEHQKKAQELLEKRLKLEKEEKALQRKICRVEDIKEIEEMQWKEDDERKTEEDRTRHLDSERLYFKNKRLMSKKEEKKKLFQDNRDEKKKYERNRVHMEEEIQRLTLCIQEKHKEYNQVKANLEMANKKRVSRRIRKRAENKKLCEELGKVTESYGLPDFWDVSRKRNASDVKLYLKNGGRKDWRDHFLNR
ncbi:structural maintenance of chromosomes protein 2-like [Puntigrus tetrazona]|uniref:structural maintenance of chromosomes protein 2-like n=1 Tax=Puntigrus tetrazona TaxID=1606681 RepID=UPI001C8A1143|nr:structural maintenance of chromosomes protein 2-like [Puntigrus tetrazona]